MKKLLMTLALAAGLSSSLSAVAPTWAPTSQKYIYTVNNSSNFIYKFNASTLQLVDQMHVSVNPGGNYIDEFYGLTRQQTTGDWYAIAYMNNSTGGDKALLKINMLTGKADIIGWLLHQCSALASDASGNLWTIGTYQSNAPGVVFKLDTSGGLTPYLDRTLIQFGNASTCGPAIAFNSDNGQLYDANYGSCSGAQQFASINLGAPSRTVINSNPNFNDYATSLAYAGNGQFLVGNYDEVLVMDQAGNVNNTALFQDPNNDKIKGIVISSENLFPQRKSLGTGNFLYTMEKSSCCPVLHQVDLSSGKTLNATPLTLSLGAETFSTYSSGPAISDMARNPLTGVIYVVGTSNVTYTMPNRFLGTVDLATGYVYPVGTTGYAVHSLAFDSSGNLYGVLGDWGSTGNSIVKINQATGAATFHVNTSIATLPNNFTTRPPALSFDAVTGALYMANGDYTRNLYKITIGSPAVVTEVVADMAYNVGKTEGMANSVAPFWMTILMGDRIGEISRSGEYIIGPVLDHNAKGIFLAPALAMQTATPSDTPTPTPVATDTPTATPVFTPMPGGLPAGNTLYLGDGDSNFIREFDMALDDYTGKALQASILGDVVLGFRALAKDPSSGIYYALVSSASIPGPWALATVNMSTGAMTLKGNTAHYMNTLAFDANGNLYGTAGSNDYPNDGDVFSINKNTGAATLLVAASNSCGIGMAYGSTDGMLYIFSGCSISNLTKISITAQTIDSSTGIGSGGLGSAKSVCALPGNNFLVGDGTSFGVFDSAGAFVNPAAYAPGYNNKAALLSNPAIAGFAGTQASTPTPTPAPTSVAWTAQPGKLLVAVDAGGGCCSGGQAGHAYVIDPFNQSYVDDKNFNISVTYSAEVDIFHGLAYRSQDGKLYAAATLASDSNRHLVTLDMVNGICTDIGSFSDNTIAGLAIDAAGNVYAQRGDNIQPYGAIYTVNIATGALTFAYYSGMDACGVSMAFEPLTGKIFSAGGCNFDDFRKLDIAGQSNVKIPIIDGSDTGFGYVKGLCAWSPGLMLMSLSDNYLYTIGIDGVAVQRASMGRSFKGLAMVPDTLAVTPTPMPTALVATIPAGKSLVCALEGGANLRVLDLATMSFTSDFLVSIPGHDIDMLTGVAKDPTANDLYVLAHYAEESNQNRELLRIDLATGVAQEVTVTTDYMVGLAFDATGNSLFALAGVASGNAGDIFAMDKNGGAAPAYVAAMPASCCGNGLGFTYNDTDGKLYQMSGSCGPTFYNSTPDGVTIGNVGTSGANCLDGMGAMGYIGGGMFLLADWSNLSYMDSLGVITSGPALPARIKGMALITGSMPVAVPTPQRTATPPAPTATPAFKSSGTDKSILGPVPATGKEPVCVYFTAAPVSSKWAVYNVGGDRVAELSFGGESSQCWSHKDVAPGLYLVRMEIETAAGKETRTQKVVILP